jgi:hypothetical protein
VLFHRAGAPDRYLPNLPAEEDYRALLLMPPEANKQLAANLF